MYQLRFNTINDYERFINKLKVSIVTKADGIQKDIDELNSIVETISDAEEQAKKLWPLKIKLKNELSISKFKV